jgi:hypothetical protein
MTFGYALFIAAIYAYVLMLAINFWVEKFGGYLGCLAMILVFFITAIAILCIILLAPSHIQYVALYVSIGFIVLTLIINLISQS